MLLFQDSILFTLTESGLGWLLVMICYFIMKQKFSTRILSIIQSNSKSCDRNAAIAKSELQPRYTIYK